MRKWINRFTGTGLLFALFTAAGTWHATGQAQTGDDERAVRAKFAEVQSAVKDKDAEKLWKLLDKRSQTDAEKTVKNIQAAYAKAGAEDKAKQEAELGLKAEDIVQMTGIAILKTKRFQAKYHEVPDSKIEKVVIQGDNATVHFLEPDGDHEKMIIVRKDGQWKVWLAIPKVVK